MAQPNPVSTAAPTTPAGLANSYARLINDIAVYFGLDGDADKEEWIGRQIHDLIDDLNMVKLWRFNLILASPINTQTGVDTYALPADLWSIYSVRKSDDIDYRLDGLRQGTFDILFQSQNNILGFPYIDVQFNVYRDGTIKLFPAPDGVYEILIRYFKLIEKPLSKDSPIDIPSPFHAVVKYGTLARVASLVGEANAVAYWEGKYQEMLQEMKDRDDYIADENLRFINIEEIGSRHSYINPNVRPRALDLY